MGGRRRSGRHILCVRLVRDAPPRFLTRGHREVGEPSVPGARGAGLGSGLEAAGQRHRVARIRQLTRRG